MDAEAKSEFELLPFTAQIAGAREYVVRLGKIEPFDITVTYRNPLTDYYDQAVRPKPHFVFGNLQPEDSDAILAFVNAYGLPTDRLQQSQWRRPGLEWAYLADVSEEIVKFGENIKLWQAVQDRNLEALLEIRPEYATSQEDVDFVIDASKTDLIYRVNEPLSKIHPSIWRWGLSDDRAPLKKGDLFLDWRFTGTLDCLYLMLALDIVGEGLVRRCAWQNCRQWFRPARGDQKYHSTECTHRASAAKYRQEHSGGTGRNSKSTKRDEGGERNGRLSKK
ncbi:MAG: hypothetical protein HY650_05585 [Acidobacteria bacterium]|nr:hypothetical protein [Acidobacteriota bacterium]